MNSYIIESDLVIMNDAYDTDDFEAAVDYSKLSDEEIHRKLIWFWFRFFRLNENFEQYCDARRSGEDSICDALEKKFPKIASLYRDWGDIHILPDMYDDDLIEWKEWLTSKHSLFFASKIELVNPGIVRMKDESVLVSIPTGLRKDQLEKLFDQFLEENQEVLGSGPAYIPMQIKGRRQSEILNRLEKAELVNDLVSGEEEFKYSHSEIAELVLKLPSLRKFGLKWYPKDEQTARLKNGSFQKSEVNGYKRTIVNLDKFFKKTVEGTIHGTFPSLL